MRAWGPAFAWSGWLTLWLRTKHGEHLADALVRSVAFLCFFGLSAASEEAGTGSGSPVFDDWGKFMGYSGAGAGSTGPEEAAQLLMSVIVALWIAALVHARRARPTIAALIADNPD